MTVLGSGAVILCRRELNPRLSHRCMGFASGVMIAASVWSLLIPAVDTAVSQGKSGWAEACGGFLLGAFSLMLFDRFISAKLSPGGAGSSFKSTMMLVLAITLHNIPEGMAVGLAFSPAVSGTAYTAAAAFAFGIGIQNFPEGAAVSLPLRQKGFGRGKAFLFGAMSGIVEPLFGVPAVLLAGAVSAVIPWLLSFAAGAMIYAVAHELIPASQDGGRSKIGTAGVIVGFCVMMALDIALG